MSRRSSAASAGSAPPLDDEERVFVREYTRTPGGRRPADGPFPGSEFLELWLAPAFARAKQRDVRLVVELDGTAGYPSSFLDEAFGGLAKQFGKDEVLKRLDVKSEAEPYLVADITQYIDEAEVA